MKYFAVIFVILAVVLAPACKKIPEACFQVVQNVDSLRVNQTVTFDASCTENGAAFDWNFSDDTSFSGRIINRQFADTGTVLVRLVVTKSTNSDGTQQYIHIKP